MTIEYKDSKRIVVLSTDVADTATYETETFTPNWDQNTTGTTNIAVANSRVEYNVTGSGTQQSTLVYDLGTANISEDKWILRGKSVITNYTVGGDGSSCHLFCGLSNGNKTVAFDGSQNSISFTIGAGTNDDNYYIGSGVNGAMYSMTSHTFAGVMAHEPTEETVYFELIRNNSTSVTLTLYTDSTYTTSPSGYTQTATLSSAPTGLRYLVFKARDRSVSGSDCEGNIDDLKFYNGVSSLTNKPTDVQDNTILVEKDLGRRFWYSPVSADTAWSQTTSNDGVNVQYGTFAETSKLGQKFETNHANVGKTFTQVTVRLKRYTAASGNASAGHIIYCKVYNSSGTARATASTTYVYSTLATSYADKTFTFATPITIGANEIVGFESNGGAYDVETFNFRVNSSSTESDTTMIDYRNGAWGTTFAAWEMMMTLGTPATATWTRNDSSMYKSTALTNAMTVGGISSAWQAITSVNNWNGSAWISGTAISPSQGLTMYRGNTDSGINCGGFSGTAIGTGLNKCQTWDGSSWVTKTSMNNRRAVGFGLGGTEDSAFATGGQDGSGGTQYLTAEKYDGSANTWATTPPPNSTYGGQGSMGAGDPEDYVNSGNQNSGGSGSSGVIETWNGTTWTTLPSSSNFTGGTPYNYGCCCGVGNDSYMQGINSDTTGTARIYKFDGSAWTDSGSATTAPKYVGMGGDSSSAIMCGAWSNGTSSSYYDGTTWTTTTALQTGRAGNGTGATT